MEPDSAPAVMEFPTKVVTETPTEKQPPSRFSKVRAWQTLRLDPCAPLRRHCAQGWFHDAFIGVRSARGRSRKVCPLGRKAATLSPEHC